MTEWSTASRFGGHMTEWSTLYERFRKLGDITGRKKSSSYVLNIVFSPAWILVEMGTYDVAEWPRHLALGPFKTEKEAFEATKAKVAEAEIAVKKEQALQAIERIG